MAAEPVSSRLPTPRRLARAVRGPCGFTLTELLIVVGLIALIASLLLPVIGRVRATAAAAACLAHLRQAGTAWTMYVVENRGRLPEHVAYDDPDTAWREAWPGLLEKQRVDVNNLLCPAASEPRPDPQNDGYGSATAAWTGKYSKTGPTRFNHETYRQSSYGYNGYLKAGRGAGLGGGKNYLSGLNNPNTVPVLFDSAALEATPENGTPDAPAEAPPDLTGNAARPDAPDHWSFVLARHGRGIHLYMADGSAAWVRVDDLYTLSWRDAWTRYRLPLPAR